MKFRGQTVTLSRRDSSVELLDRVSTCGKSSAFLSAEYLTTGSLRLTRHEARPAKRYGRNAHQFDGANQMRNVRFGLR